MKAVTCYIPYTVDWGRLEAPTLHTVKNLSITLQLALFISLRINQPPIVYQCTNLVKKACSGWTHTGQTRDVRGQLYTYSLLLCVNSVSIKWIFKML